MLISKLMFATAILLGAVFIGTTGGLFTMQFLKAGQPDARNASATPLVPQDRKAPSKGRKGDHQEEGVSYRVGEILQPRFFLKNTEKDPLEIGYPRLITQSYYKALHVIDKEGQKILYDQAPQVPVPVGWVGVKLLEGKYAETTGLFLSIGNETIKGTVETVLKVSPGQTCRVRYTLPNYGDSKADNLQTGEFSFKVVEKVETDFKQPTAEELSKHIAWGKPGKNGLQIGVLLVPFEENPTKNRDAKEKGVEPQDR